jgi:hypothetical protein
VGANIQRFLISASKRSREVYLFLKQREQEFHLAEYEFFIFGPKRFFTKYRNIKIPET